MMDQDDNSKHRDLMGYLPTDTADWMYASVAGIGDMLFQRIGYDQTAKTIKARYPSIVWREEDNKTRAVRFHIDKYILATVGLIGEEMEISEDRITIAAKPTSRAISGALQKWKPKLIDIGTPGELNRLDHFKGGKGVD